MELLTCIVLACSICVSLNVAFVRGQNGTSNQTDQDSSLGVEHHLQNFVSKLLRTAFVNEFNRIMSSKNEEIQSLNKKIAEKDKIIKTNGKKLQGPSSIEGISEENVSPSRSANEEATLKPNSLENSGLKYFVKKRIRALFQKELDRIIREKDAQIYLLNELLKEKEKTIKLQKGFIDKKISLKPKSVIDGIGEPSYSEFLESVREQLIEVEQKMK